jgi:ectoine hydroxylase-related dioxygenase (phytanoyl-CoA dioxygenase family)|tara:strand:- start:19 stop:786 length:768 start_codon:yes stop_codon:yes gene_type:complete
MINYNKIRKNFETNGYMVIKNFLSKKKCNVFLKRIKKYANNDYAPIMNPDREEFLISQTIDKILNHKYLGDKANFLYAIKKECAFFRSLMLNKKILKIITKIKKKKVSAIMSQMIFKEKKTKYSKQSWLPHQDNSYPKNRNGQYITINIFMNKTTKKNGSLYIYENSHKYGIFKYIRKISYREKDSKPGNYIVTDKFKKTDLCFNKGDMLILHGNLIHGSYSNNSNSSRPMYSVSYIPKGEKFIPGPNAQRKVLN